MANTPTIKNPVGWFEIYVKDMNRARSFYETLFEVKLQSLGVDFPEMLAFPSGPEAMSHYGTGGALVKMDGVGGNGTLGTMVYFFCEDCGVSAKKAVRLGGTLHKDKFSIGPYGFVALITDSEGNRIGLHSRATESNDCG